MYDVAACPNSLCPSSGSCARFYQGTLNHERQTYSCFSPGEALRCDAYIERDVEEIIEEWMSEVDGPSPAMEARLRAGRQFEAAFGRHVTLPDGCLWLRMAKTGAGDPLSPDAVEAMLQALEARLAAWTPSYSPTVAKFDEAVRQLVIATIDEVAPGRRTS